MGVEARKTSRFDGAHHSGQRPASPRRVGLVAGWGDYPLIVARALRESGHEVYCLGLAGHADPKLAEICHDFRFLGLAKFGRAIRYFKQHGVTDATMAGKIRKVVLFRLGGWLQHLPDLRTIRMFAPHFLTRRKDQRDDTLLGAIVNEFGCEGIHFGPATDYAPGLLVQQGQLTERGPSPREQKDIEFGWQVAKELGRLDIGQSAVIKNRAVMALEAIEGTDECIRRAGGLCKAGGFTVVKVAKPQQDMRFDVPTIGRGTLETMVAAGGRVLAVESRRTIILDQPELIDFANRNRLSVVALENPDAGASQEKAIIPEIPSLSRER